MDKNNNILDFVAYRQFRLDMEEEKASEDLRENVMNWMLNPTEYTTDSFTFTLEDSFDE